MRKPKIVRMIKKATKSSRKFNRWMAKPVKGYSFRKGK